MDKFGHVSLAPASIGMNGAHATLLTATSWILLPRHDLESASIGAQSMVDGGEPLSRLGGEQKWRGAKSE